MQSLWKVGPFWTILKLTNCGSDYREWEPSVRPHVCLWDCSLHWKGWGAHWPLAHCMALSHLPSCFLVFGYHKFQSLQKGAQKDSHLQ